MTFKISTHDSYPPEETALVDRGLGDANAAAAPLHEVRPLSCFARNEAGRVVGGAVGRWWGQGCELHELWVEPSFRRRGIATELVQAFEARAGEHAVRLSTSRHSISSRRVCTNRWTTPSPTRKRFTRTASLSTSWLSIPRIRTNQ